MTTILILLAFGGLLGGLVCLRLKAEARQERQSNTQDHIIEQNTFETGHSSVYRVTKDPQKYARIFSPRRR